MIAENLLSFREKLKAAAEQAGRKAEEIALVAVSKTMPNEKIIEAIDAGQMDFGENYAQELKKKHEEINRPARWHFIGQLQTNKVKYIFDKVYLVQSVDRRSLAKELDKRAAAAQSAVDILLQLYPYESDNRGGAGMEQIKKLLEECGDLTNIRIKGIMSVAPFGLDEDQSLHYFEKVKRMFENLSAHCPDNASMDILSMGMTADYIQAIRQGSNMVRIGSAIFGGRPHNANGG